MDKFSQRENVLLGYSPQRGLGSHSSSPRPPFRHPDVDFHDVFGGPPRRSSMHEMRHSFGESMNSSKSTIPGEEDRVLPRNPWSGMNEMPVFGEETVNRRRYPSEDFFDDIFRGDESPRRSDRDPFGSTPASRVMSPARPLPPRTDPFGTSLPAQFQFSLPSKSSKALEYPAFDSGNRSPYKHKDPTSNGRSTLSTPSSPLSGLPSDAFSDHVELKNETQSSYRPSPLSHEFSISSTEPAYMIESDDLKLQDLNKDLKTTEALSNSNQFHFSIYKWASKGVPLLTPLRRGNSSKPIEKFKTERCSSSNGRIQGENTASGLKTAILHDCDIHLNNNNLSSSNESPNAEGRKQEEGSLLYKSTEGMVEPGHIIEESVLCVPGSQFSEILNGLEAQPDDSILSDKREKLKPHCLSEKGLRGNTGQEVSTSVQISSDKIEEIDPYSLSESTEKRVATNVQETRKPELKPLRSLFQDTDEGQGNDEMHRQYEAESSMAKKATISHSNLDANKKVKRREKRSASSKAEAIQVDVPVFQGSSGRSSDNFARNGVRGKVKEFVKIFNHEASSKPKSDVEAQTQSSRWKGTVNSGGDKEGIANTTESKGKHHVQVKDKMKAPTDASVMVDKNFAESEKQQFHSETSVFNASENFLSKKHAPKLSSESHPNGPKVRDSNIDDLFQGSFTIKELSDDQDKLPQNGEGYEDVQNLDAKIRKWFNGKQGNIRSLLSTLQYVLWPGSGWKPVPLVDIIEGSAVKRSYQKALLCLHPDKLQQKGATSHQKYVAEKVFDILQESWDHFNSLGAI